MRTVLVCVRTPLAAQNVAAAAARLGVASAVRTAVSDPEAMLRLAERPVDVVLADTALTRPDSVGFTRRVLARSPGAAILLLGTEEPAAAAAAIAAGARGLIQGGDNDLVSVVAKAILLLGTTGRAGRPGGPPAAGAGVAGGALPAGSAGVPGAAGPGRPGEAGQGGGAAASGHRIGSVLRAPGTAPDPLGPGGSVPPGTAGPGNTADRPGTDEGPRGGPGGIPGESTGPAMVPAQRGDDPDSAADPAASGPTLPGGVAPTGGAPTGAEPAGRAAPDPRGRGGPGGADSRTGEPGRPEPDRVAPPRRPLLTEREMQVLVGMADGKSNAEIGRELFVSEDTVKTHARRLFRKLGARDRAHAVAAGFRAGLVA
ncbi:LuxR C-terminal-related transcriptional regulator [Plantactinospora sp. B5E13]|uniref:response regulator transcription factor n=1 Tax=unclassified Plantactinospora TaxID=2631981 RepID=UPI00325E32B5